MSLLHSAYIRDEDSTLGLERSPGGGHGNTLQYSCLKNLMDRGTWKATVYRTTELDMTEATQHECTKSIIYLRIHSYTFYGF